MFVAVYFTSKLFSIAMFQILGQRLTSNVVLDLTSSRHPTLPFAQFLSQPRFGSSKFCPSSITISIDDNQSIFVDVQQGNQFICRKVGVAGHMFQACATI